MLYNNDTYIYINTLYYTGLYRTIQDNAGLHCTIQDYMQGVQKKMRRSFCFISLATNMLEGLNSLERWDP